jgi:2-dehydropantoate 2-reductase
VRAAGRMLILSSMRIAIVGAGGVGGLLGGLLARAGAEVVLVARGNALEAIRRDGLRVDSPMGTFGARVAAASDDPAALPAADAVLVAVKAWQVAEVAPRLAPLVAPGGVVVPLQNGVEAADQLAAALGPGPVAGGVVKCLAWLDGPGRVKHVGDPPEVIAGERGARAGGPSPRLAALAAALEQAGVKASVAADVERAAWEKFLLVEPWGAVASAARAPIGVLRSLPEARALLLQAMDEVASLARERGVALPPDAAARTAAFIDTLPPEGTVSMQRDLGAGRPSELEDQVGAVVRLARAAGVAAPVHAALHAALLPQEAAARGRIPRFPRT